MTKVAKRGPGRPGTPVKVGAVVYKSLAAAAKAKGVTYATVYARFKKGTVEGLLKKPTKPTVSGVPLAEAAKAAGVPYGVALARKLAGKRGKAVLAPVRKYTKRAKVEGEAAPAA